MKKYFTFLIAAVTISQFSSAQVTCIFCYNQNDSISTGVNNLLLNGSFESGCAAGGYFCPNATSHSCNITNWTCTGGGSSTYAHVLDNTSFSVVAAGSEAVYFGNYYCNACSPTVDDTACLNKLGCTVTGIPVGYPVNPDPNYGGATGLSLQQTVGGLTIGNTYVLEFWAGGEEELGFWPNDGVFAVNVGFGDTFLLCHPTDPAAGGIGIRYIIEFKATATSHTIKFTNWGHICATCTELVLDDAKLYTLAQLSASVPSCSTTLSANANETDTHCGQCDGTAAATPLGGNSPFTYLWNNGATTQNISALCAGPYTVTITDSSGTTATATATVAPTGSADSVNVSANQTIMCPSDSALICATAGFSAYQWNTGDTSQCIYTQLAGNYYVTVTDTSSCTAVSNHITINVYPSPPTSVSVNGDTLTAHGATTYQWYLNGSPIGGATDSVYIATLGGSYTVAVTDTNGCGAVSNAVVISGISPVSPGEGSGVRIYPNPATNQITIAVDKDWVGGKVETTDILGRQMQTSIVEHRISHIELSSITSGVYFVRVCKDDKQVTRKLVVEK